MLYNILIKSQQNRLRSLFKEAQPFCMKVMLVSIKFKFYKYPISFINKAYWVMLPTY